jgi:hypothetical protein
LQLECAREVLLQREIDQLQSQRRRTARLEIPSLEQGFNGQPIAAVIRTLLADGDGAP